MLDGLFDSMKGQVVGTIMEKTGLSTEQAEAAMPAAQESVKEGLMGAVTGGDMAGITSMFSGGDMASSGIFQTIKNLFVGKLMGNVGLPSGMAGMVSTAALPMIMNQVKGGLAGEDGGIDAAGLMGKLTGSEGGGIMDAVTGGAGGVMDAVKGNADSATDALKDKMGGIGNLLG